MADPSSTRHFLSFVPLETKTSGRYGCPPISTLSKGPGLVVLGDGDSADWEGFGLDSGRKP